MTDEGVDFRLKIGDAARAIERALAAEHPEPPEESLRSLAASLALLWLCGASLRLTVLAVPPVIPAIHGSLSLTQAAVGALASLPVLTFSLMALPGALLIARFGAARVLALGLALAAVASAARGAAPGTAALFAATFVMGMGIAFMQPALPTIVRSRLPARIALGTAVYSNGLLMGEALPASLTLPFVMPALDGSWRASLVAWSVPVAVVFLLALPAALRDHGAPARTGPRPKWWPDWRSPVVWGLGIVSGATSAVYYCLNAFLPDFLRHTGRGDLIGPALSALNWAQIPASVLLLAFSTRLAGRPGPIAVMGAVSLAALAGLVALPGSWVVAMAAVIGFTTAFVLILTLALPALLAEPDDVPRVSAAMFALGYLFALVVPVAGGALWDLSGRPATAFGPAALMVAGMLAAPWLLRARPPDPSRSPGARC